MSMDYSEFLRRLGADPNDPDPELRRAREAGEEFERAAIAAERLERQLGQAVRLPEPEGLLDQLKAIGSETPPAVGSRRRFRNLALAAGLLIAVGAAGITWNLNRGWDSVDDYVADHYHHDGDKMLHRTGPVPAGDVQEIFARFDMQTGPNLAGIVRGIKYCPTPDGKGVHMVLATDQGPVTVIYMPETPVQDHQEVAFDDMDAMYVRLQRGSAVIIGTPEQGIGSFYSLVQQSLVAIEKEA